MWGNAQYYRELLFFGKWCQCQRWNVVVCCTFCNAFFNIFTCCLCNNTHILCLLSDVTSYTDSVASHSQSGYPNRKVHVFPFLKKKKLVYKRRKKNIPSWSQIFDHLITACYRGLVSRGEQWLRLFIKIVPCFLFFVFFFSSN